MELGAPGIDTPWQGTFLVTPCAPRDLHRPPILLLCTSSMPIRVTSLQFHFMAHFINRLYAMSYINQLDAMRYATIPGLQHRPRQRHRLDVLTLHQGCHNDLSVGRHLCVPKRQARVGSDADAGIEKDMSWTRPTLQYEQVFEWVMIDPPYAA